MHSILWSEMKCLQILLFSAISIQLVCDNVLLFGFEISCDTMICSTMNAHKCTQMHTISIWQSFCNTIIIITLITTCFTPFNITWYHSVCHCVHCVLLTMRILKTHTRPLLICMSLSVSARVSICSVKLIYAILLTIHTIDLSLAFIIHCEHTCHQHNTVSHPLIIHFQSLYIQFYIFINYYTNQLLLDSNFFIELFVSK